MTKAINRLLCLCFGHNRWACWQHGDSIERCCLRCGKSERL